MRVIPCLDVKDGRVVKGVSFVSLRDAGDPVEQAAAYDAAGVPQAVVGRALYEKAFTLAEAFEAAKHS